MTRGALGAAPAGEHLEDGALSRAAVAEHDGRLAVQYSAEGVGLHEVVLETALDVAFRRGSPEADEIAGQSGDAHVHLRILRMSGGSGSPRPNQLESGAVGFDT